MAANKGGRRINITGTAGKTYNMDAITSSNTRVDASKPMASYIKLYNPLSKDPSIKSVIPEDVKIGYMWIARKDTNLFGQED